MSATDLLTLTEAGQALEGFSIADGAIPMPLLIEAATGRITDLCGPVVAATTTRVLNSTGADALILGPTLSVTQVRTRRYIGAPWIALPTTDYEVAGRWLYATNGQRWPRGRSTVEVTGTFGRCVDTASVSSRFKQAAAVVLREMWAYTLVTFTPPPQNVTPAPGDVFVHTPPITVIHSPPDNLTIHDLLGDEIISNVLG